MDYLNPTAIADADERQQRAWEERIRRQHEDAGSKCPCGNGTDTPRSKFRGLVMAGRYGLPCVHCSVVRDFHDLTPRDHAYVARTIGQDS